MTPVSASASRSGAKLRPSPSVPAKSTVTQSIAPAIPRAGTVGSSANEKTTATSTAKTAMATKRSRERASSRRSFAATAHARAR